MDSVKKKIISFGLLVIVISVTFGVNDLRANCIQRSAKVKIGHVSIDVEPFLSDSKPWIRKLGKVLYRSIEKGFYSVIKGGDLCLNIISLKDEKGRKLNPSQHNMIYVKEFIEQVGKDDKYFLHDFIKKTNLTHFIFWESVDRDELADISEREVEFLYHLFDPLHNAIDTHTVNFKNTTSYRETLHTVSNEVHTNIMNIATILGQPQLGE